MYLCRFSAGAFFLRMENCNSLRVIGQTALLMDKNVEKHLSDTYAAQGIKVHLWANNPLSITSWHPDLIWLQDRKDDFWESKLESKGLSRQSNTGYSSICCSQLSKDMSQDNLFCTQRQEEYCSQERHDRDYTRLHEKWVLAYVSHSLNDWMLEALSLRYKQLTNECHLRDWLINRCLTIDRKWEEVCSTQKHNSLHPRSPWSPFLGCTGMSHP